jgi:hypothetical protein
LNQTGLLWIIDSGAEMGSALQLILHPTHEQFGISINQDETQHNGHEGYNDCQPIKGGGHNECPPPTKEGSQHKMKVKMMVSQEKMKATVSSTFSLNSKKPSTQKWRTSWHLLNDRLKSFMSSMLIGLI